MKIVNNRENIWDVKLTDTHFVRERESRYGKLKNHMEKNGYKRSNSRKGFCRAAPSAQRYVKIEMNLDLEVNQVEQDLIDTEATQVEQDLVVQKIDLDLNLGRRVIKLKM